MLPIVTHLPSLIPSPVAAEGCLVCQTLRIHISSGVKALGSVSRRYPLLAGDQTCLLRALLLLHAGASSPTVTLKSLLLVASSSEFIKDPRVDPIYQREGAL
jgi:hypothetical protein